jgi:hypothetical protein
MNAVLCQERFVEGSVEEGAMSEPGRSGWSRDFCD